MAAIWSNSEILPQVFGVITVRTYMWYTKNIISTHAVWILFCWHRTFYVQTGYIKPKRLSRTQ